MLDTCDYCPNPLDEGFGMRVVGWSEVNGKTFPLAKFHCLKCTPDDVIDEEAQRAAAWALEEARRPKPKPRPRAVSLKGNLQYPSPARLHAPPS